MILQKIDAKVKGNQTLSECLQLAVRYKTKNKNKK